MLRIAKFFNFANLNGTKINNLMTEAIIYTKRIHLWEKISNFGCSFLRGVNQCDSLLKEVVHKK